MEENQKQRRRRKIIFAQRLRKKMTKAEAILWEALRDRRCADMKFRRQTPLSWFIADFLSMKYRLIIEVDGSVHATQTAYDQERDEELSRLGYKVLRMTNDAVLHDLEDCIQKILLSKRY